MRQPPPKGCAAPLPGGAWLAALMWVVPGKCLKRSERGSIVEKIEKRVPTRFEGHDGGGLGRIHVLFAASSQADFIENGQKGMRNFIFEEVAA